MKPNSALKIEPAENGWLVIEVIFHDESDDDDESSAWSKEREEPRDEEHSINKIHVFVDHTKLMAFVLDRTKPTKTSK